MVARGWNAEGVDRLHAVLDAHVENSRLPGYVALVALGNRTETLVGGWRDLTRTAPLQRDDLFRIASLGKPVVAAAVLTMVDDGTLRLDDPVDQWLPELADRQVLRDPAGPLDDTEPARRPICVEDLLTSRMGFGTVLAEPGSTPLQRAEAELGLGTLTAPWPPVSLTTDEWLAGLGSLPLMHHPGEGWRYNTGQHVAGALVERVSGQPLEAVMRTRIFDPLGMSDSGYSVPARAHARFTSAYAPDPVTGSLELLDPARRGWWTTPLPFPSAAGWMVSTLDDYWAFVRMLLSNGLHRGRRVLSGASVRAMLSDQLTADQRPDAEAFLARDQGWGYGLAVPARGRRPERLAAATGWDGGTGTTWRSDLERGVTGILFTQRAMTSPEPPEAFQDFWAGLDELAAGDAQ